MKLVNCIRKSFTAMVYYLEKVIFPRPQPREVNLNWFKEQAN
jgi:hypothetical protein